MKILVTGHRGFIGSHVYEHLTELGFDDDGYDIPYDLSLIHISEPTRRM